jgi:membrane protein YdbS with pleckstrin-like domain
MFSREGAFSHGSPAVLAGRASIRDRGMKLRAFLTTVMSLLSILVFGLGFMQQDVLWSFLGFVSVVVSGVFVQLFINLRKTQDPSSRR